MKGRCKTSRDRKKRSNPQQALTRANELDGVAVRGEVLTVRGTLDAKYRKGRLRLDVLGGRRMAGCTSGKPLRRLGSTKLDRETGRYEAKVRAPKGSGRVILRVRARSAKEGNTFSVFAVR